jgi:hypothetical protein
MAIFFAIRRAIDSARVVSQNGCCRVWSAILGTGRRMVYPPSKCVVAGQWRNCIDCKTVHVREVQLGHGDACKPLRCVNR